MFVLGLTGSIGMGKSTAASMFRRLGCPVHDADGAVHRLLGPGGGAVEAVAKRFPGVLSVQGGIDRQKLGAQVFKNASALSDLETILHPLVRREEEAFLARARSRREKLAVLDIPLLFETGGDQRCHATALVTAPAFVQGARVLARPGMTLEKFQQIRTRQMPDAEKRGLADWILPTGLGKRFTFECIRALVRKLRED
ncbi:MAG: dephospho-CoA kinase [Alphaproteobacteria bacterium]|nr:dephospho-CoA kinase [Alphaproteobacteria bacterium]